MNRRAIVLVGFLLAGCGLAGRGQGTPSATATLPTPVITNVAVPDPETAARKFLDAWRQGNYDAMYAMLSPLSQDSLTKDDFVATYKKAAQEAALTGLDYQIVASLVNPREAQVSYRITLHSSVVGDVTRDTTLLLKRAGQDWQIAWSATSILPELTDGNKLFLQVVAPTRANIYDRNGQALATEADITAIYIIPNQIGDQDAEATMLTVLSRLLDERPESIQALYDNIRQTDYYTPVGEVAQEDFQRVEGTLAGLSGVAYRTYSGRFYPEGEAGAQTVGYVSQITKEQVDEYKSRGYRGDEFVGQAGLEFAFENQLRGTPGGKLLVTDVNGQPVSVLGARDPGLPQAVYTTLDRDLERNAQQALAGFAGAVVVLERDTGAVLAMTSAPSFDPNLFDSANPNSGVGLSNLSLLNQPFVNRATKGTYPLGSVFKIITMSSALETGKFTPGSIYTTDGYFRELPGWVGQDWTVDHDLPPQGTLTLVQGLERSCNPYFWHIGLTLFNDGLTTALPDMAKQFDLGKATGIEIGENPGLVPDPVWTKAQGRDWGPGDSVQLAIGQASLQVTPLQVARFVAAVGNGGTLYQPQLISRIQTAEGDVSHQFKPIEVGKLPVSPDNLGTIQQAMTGVIRDPKGTAYRRFLGLSLVLAGKTGTATSGSGTDPHAWFVVYSSENRPDKPDIAVAVLLEYQGEGADWAAPVARRVLESYFFGRPFQPYPWESQIGVTRTPTPTEGPGGPQATDTPTPP